MTSDCPLEGNRAENGLFGIDMQQFIGLKQPSIWALSICLAWESKLPRISREIGENEKKR